MECWAAELGGCAGKITKEHWISRCLADGLFMKVRGLPFCDRELVEVAWSSAAANVLCEHHNSALSPVDSEAKRLKVAMERLQRSDDLPGTTEGWSGPDTIELSGERVARWVAKCWCNLRSVSRRTVPAEFIRYAFGQGSLFSYLVARPGTSIGTAEGHYGFLELIADDESMGVLVELFGLWWILSRQNLKGGAPMLEFGPGKAVQAALLLEGTATLERSRQMPSGDCVVDVRVVLEWPATRRNPQPLPSRSGMIARSSNATRRAIS